MREILVVHYDEIALKRGRRSYYERSLAHAIRTAARDLGVLAVRKAFGRILVHTITEGIDLDVVAERLTRVFGVRYLTRGFEVAPTPEGMGEAVDRLVDLLPAETPSFAVRARRIDKAFPWRSLEIDRRMGARIATRKGWKVNLDHPAVTVQIEVLVEAVLVAGGRLEGPGGLPIGTSGRGLALISGGIDSPVAAWMMLGRGLRLSFVHFHSAPYTDRASQDKVRDLLRLLSRWQPTIDVVFIPFATTVQNLIVEKARPELRVILYRRFMMRIAEALAARGRATCLITGDALGQVASQTIENLTTVSAATTLPILRPLVGMNKDQIIGMAQRLGTFETSIEPHDDCCGFLMPRSPATVSTIAEAVAEEAKLPVAEMIAAALAGAEVSMIRFDVPVAPR